MTVSTKLISVIKVADVIYKIKNLEELARLGDKAEVLLLTINKLTRYKIEELERDLKEINTQLSVFEKKYKMKNEEFFSMFESGKLGDNLDCMEWSSLLDMRERIKKRYNILKGA